jgi:hypothetical protein
MKCPECQFDNREGVKFCEAVFLLRENSAVNVAMI